MISQSVIYQNEIKTFVENYEKLPTKDGDYWNQKGNTELIKVKKHIKDHYLKEQKYTCAYCRQSIYVSHNGAWDTDHIIPKDVNPEFMFTPKNLCVSCKDCNGEKLNQNVLEKKPKKNQFPSESGDYIFIHPHFDRYEDYMTIVNNPLYFFPHKKKGTNTFRICGLIRFAYKYGEVDIKELSIGLNETVQSLTSEFQNTKSINEEKNVFKRIRKMFKKE